MLTDSFEYRSFSRGSNIEILSQFIALCGKEIAYLASLHPASGKTRTSGRASEQTSFS